MNDNPINTRDAAGEGTKNRANDRAALSPPPLGVALLADNAVTLPWRQWFNDLYRQLIATIEG